MNEAGCKKEQCEKTLQSPRMMFKCDDGWLVGDAYASRGDDDGIR